MDPRYQLLESWVREQLGFKEYHLAPASSDASFRRYFRLAHRGASHIVMDAPPDKEDCRPFVKVARAMSARGLNVPRILETDLRQGFLLLSDLGDRPYLPALNGESVQRLYGDACRALRRLQGAPVDEVELPSYDRTLLMNEMGLFRAWLLTRHLGLHAEADDEALMRSCEFLAASALEQPLVWVHRDYHSRNLMVTEADNPGVLDFQDAVWGPLTYDLVSLLRDCYIRWPLEQVMAWVDDYHSRAAELPALAAVDRAQFRRWFDLMGIQRHLKAAGIFARLYHRDGKPGYLGDIPRTLGYVVEAGAAYPELAALRTLIIKQVLPGLEAAQPSR